MMARVRDTNRRAINTLANEKHFWHCFASKAIRRMLFKQFSFDVWQMPVCERCEGWAYWHRDEQGNPVAVCPGCGHTTREPITVEHYYEQGFHTDRTVRRDAPVYIGREQAKKGEAATVYGGEAGLPEKDKKYLLVPRRKII